MSRPAVQSPLQPRPASREALPCGLPELRVLARTWILPVDERKRQTAAWAFTAETIRAYAQSCGEILDEPLLITPLRLALTYHLTKEAIALAHAIGQEAAQLPPLQACYQLSATYTAMLPAALRSAWGAYYTPPALTDRLLTLAVEAGVDWATARVFDPACGGGAFLLPVALQMRTALVGLSAGALLEHLGSHLCGFEIDPFAAWLTQVWLEIAFAQEVRASGKPFPPVVRVCDALIQLPAAEPAFDLVIGNPPYGRVTLSSAQRSTFKRGLFGHANLYGVFTDLALRWTIAGGVIALVTPTSFLAGEYFKALRAVLAEEAPPLALDFLRARRGVFEDVLQEAALSTYRRGGQKTAAAVHHLVVDERGTTITATGSFSLPTQPSAPWIAPREPAHCQLVEQLATMPTRLSDWGYQVSTGPLVWNRFKDQLGSQPGSDVFPLIWAEAVTADGRFVNRCEKRNHAPFFRARAGDEWLRVTRACVLVQRTTAKEQQRRLIAAEMPATFIAQHGAVVVENHLNMVRPIAGLPKVSPAAVAAVLNSHAADQAFRCISGSVAVSAFELEALPLPSIAQMRKVDALIQRQAAAAKIEAAISRIYKLA